MARNQVLVSELIDWCEQYDIYNGKYPESELEGEAVLNFIMNKLAEENPELGKTN